MKITAARLSIIQFETLPDPLRSRSPQKLNYPFLVSKPLFQQKYAQLETGGDPEFELPFEDDYGLLFWLRYVPARGDRKLVYWRGLLPLKWKRASTVMASGGNATASFHAYLYPWGIGVIADVTLKASLDCDRAVSEIMEIRGQRKFKVTRAGSTADETLDETSREIRNELRGGVYGSTIPPGSLSGPIFTIVTVTDADTKPTTEPSKDPELLKMFEGLSGWNKDWKQLTPDVSKRTIEIKTSPPSNLLYGGKRGRAVWFPSRFGETGLSCFHQNLSVASLQTESLCCLIKDVADQLTSDASLTNCSVAYENCAHLAAGLLGRLQGGKDTYRSGSVRSQIDATYKDALDAVRKQYWPDPTANP